MNQQDVITKKIKMLILTKQIVQTSFRFISTEEEIKKQCAFIDEWIEELQRDIEEESSV